MKRYNISRYLLIFLLLLVTSCKSVEYIKVPVETVRTEYVDRVLRDSIYVESNTNTITRNDTVFVDKVLYKYKYINKTDTVSRVDTVTVVQEVIKEVETNKLKDWQLVLMMVGCLTIGGVIIYVTNKFKK